VRRAISVGRL